MTDDSLEFEDFEALTSQPTVTAWSSQVASRAKSVRTYGRRGSTGAIPRSSQCKPQMRFKPSRIEQTSDCLSPTDEEQEFGQIADIENRSLPVFRLDIPKLPGRKRFTRAHSMDVGSSETDAYPVLRRSASVSLTHEHSSSMSARSSSISSYMDSYSEMGSENVHPNMCPLEEMVSPKRSGRSVEARGRKKVRSARNLTTMDQAPLDSLSNSASFSNLARDESSTWAKAAPPKRSSTLTFNELEFLEYSSPAMSSVCSNRKRGICDSPFDDLDDCQSVGSLSVSRRSWMMSSPTHPIGEFHADSTQKLNHCAQEKSKCNKKAALMEIVSDDGDSGVDSRGGMDSDDEGSLDSNPHRRSPMPTFVPFDQRQSRRSSIPIFSEESIGPQLIHPGTASVDDVINSIPSYNDLKYLVMRLRGQPDRRVCWHVALPNTWGEAQRRAFISWITNTLGFTYRKAGAQAAYFQIPRSKGTSILQLLEFAIETCQERGIGAKSPSNANTPANRLTFGITPIQKVSERAIARFTPVGLNMTTSGNLLPQASNDLDPELMKGLDSLGMDDRPPIAKSVSAVPESSIVLDDDCEVPLRDPRDSLENHSSSRDLMAHMHGLTPIDTHYRRPRLSTGVGPMQGTINNFNIASPYPQPMVSTVACHSKNFSNDFVATPMMKPLGWGSCPLEGRDWGISEGCDERVSQALLRMLELASHEAGYSFEEDEIQGGETRSFALELELEAAGEYRMGESSPDSVSDKESSEEGGLFSRAELSDSSLPSRSGCEILDDDFGVQPDLRSSRSRAFRRRQTEFDKRARLSLFAAAVNPTASIFGKRKSLFQRPLLGQVATSPRLKVLVSEHKFEASIQPWTGEIPEAQSANLLKDECILKSIFLFLTEPELLRSAFLVCTTWADAATQAHAELMCLGVGCSNSISGDFGSSDEDGALCVQNSQTLQGDKSWNYLTSTFPWARFLAEGGFKQVYQVFNRSLRAMEAVSVMDIEALRASGELNIVGAELAVSVMLSSLVRRGVCPNFVVTRGAFSCVYKPPAKIWGSENNRNPNGATYHSPVNPRKMREPKARGRYQYIRMELCELGDAEEFIKTLPDETLDPEVARKLLFQMAFALHIAAERFSLKHYDVKLLNYFIQTMKSDKSGDIVLRYGVGDLVFALRSPKSSAFLAKLADYGTANVDSATDGQQVTIAQFTTLENTPVDFLLLGDSACQGHGHDSFGLGLCMLHLYTGHAPYEEILEKVTCPPNLKERLRNLWECEDEEQYSVIRGVILSNVVKDEEGHILEGEPNDVLYDTLYRFLVLFGIPDLPAHLRTSKVWCVVRECLEGHGMPRSKAKRGKNACDVDQYIIDCRKYSIDRGTDKFIRRARVALETLDGGMDLLKSLVSFDPITRSTALDVMNSKFMEPLREAAGGILGYGPDDDLRTFSSFPTKNES